jgi:hypothetical protein
MDLKMVCSLVLIHFLGTAMKKGIPSIQKTEKSPLFKE